jgi:hypothetical protein
VEALQHRFQADALSTVVILDTGGHLVWRSVDPTGAAAGESRLTGKVTGVSYDRFEDVEGFTLGLESGRERLFRGREHAVEDLQGLAGEVRRVGVRGPRCGRLAGDNQPDASSPAPLRRYGP